MKRPVFLRAAWMIVVLAGVTACSAPESYQQEAGGAVQIGELFAGDGRRLELSGCAVVDGGILMAEDELVGSVLYADEVTQAPVALSMVKLERKKKQRAPFAPQDKLFPRQDFEGMASDGGEDVYLLGSHNGKGGERRPDREFLLRGEWDAEDGELKVVGEHYDLLEAIAPLLEGIGAGIGVSETEVDEDFNLEGLAYHDETLYLGLRSPLSGEGRAVIVVAEVSEVFGDGETLALEVVEVDLDGSGIRGLTWDTRDGTLLAIGAREKGETATALWRVEPDSANAERVHVFEEEIAKKKPEGICRLPNGELLVVLDGEDGSRATEMMLLPGN